MEVYNEEDVTVMMSQEETLPIVEEPDDDDSEDGVDDDEPEVESQERPGPLSRKTTTRKGILSAPKKSKRKGPPKQLLPEFLADDHNDIQAVTGVLEEIVGDVLKCGKSLLQMGFDEPTKEKHFNVFKQTMEQAVGAVETLKLAPMAVNKVMDDLGLVNKKTGRMLNENEYDKDSELTKVVDLFGQKAFEELRSNREETSASVKGKVSRNMLYKNAVAELKEACKPNKETEPGPSTSSGARPSTRRSAGRDSSEQNTEGLEALTEYVPTHDPITRKLLNDIRVNRFCGHVYEYTSIMAMITSSKTRGIKCPYPACTNKKLMKYEDLVEDKDMAAKIAQEIAEKGLKN